MSFRIANSLSVVFCCDNVSMLLDSATVSLRQALTIVFQSLRTSVRTPTRVLGQADYFVAPCSLHNILRLQMPGKQMVAKYRTGYGNSRASSLDCSPTTVSFPPARFPSTTARQPWTTVEMQLFTLPYYLGLHQSVAVSMSTASQ